MDETAAAADDDELKEALIKHLNENGTLGKIRAQLRAAVFLAIEKQDKVKTIPQLSSEKTELFVTKSGEEGETAKLSLALCHDLLQNLELTITDSVFEKELGKARASMPTKNDVASRLALNEDAPTPLLMQLISAAQSRNTLPSRSKTTEENEHETTTKIERPTMLTLTDDKLSAITGGIQASSKAPTRQAAIEQPPVGDLNDKDGKTLSPPKQSLSSSNSLEKSLDLDKSPRKVPTPQKHSLTGAAPQLSSPADGSSPSVAKTPLTSLPELGGPGRRLGSLPPLGGGNASAPPIADIKPPLPTMTAVGGDFSSLFGDTKTHQTTSSSGSSSDSTNSVSTPGREGDNEEKQADRRTLTPQPTSATNTVPVAATLAPTIFKKPSPRDTISSVSEEIAEDIEVDDLLGSGRSSDGF